MDVYFIQAYNSLKTTMTSYIYKQNDLNHFGCYNFPIKQVGEENEKIRLFSEIK